MSDEEMFLWARLSVLQGFVQYSLVQLLRRESDRAGAFAAAKVELKKQAERVRVPLMPIDVRRRLFEEISRATDQMLDDIAAQLG
jgi:hypothetical protein